MKPNVIVALLVGFVLGFAVRVAYNGTSSRPDAPQAIVGSATAPFAASEAALPIKSSDFPAETFAGLTDAQKYAAMKVLNDNPCDCGCPNDTVAECAKKDPNCPLAPAKMRQAAALAKAGKSAAQIQAEMFGGAPKAAPAKPPSADDATVFKVPIDGSPASGQPTALITMVEFSDYQCPYCSKANATVEQLQREYGDKLRVVMKQNPLPMHPQAKPAALAALAAGRQGKYWEMHRKLFANQQALDAPKLEEYAREIGLDVARWKQGLSDPKVEQTVVQDQALAASVGANGTPAFFINGRKLSGAQPVESFRKLIDEELAKAEAAVQQGVKPDAVYAQIMEKAGAGAAAEPSKPPSPTAANGAQPAVAKLEVGRAPVKGPKNAPVTIVEFSDFECPYCKNVVPTLHEIEKQYGKQVKVAFKHWPLPFHNHARLAAAASMAADEQGKFWEYHDKLFANQQGLERASLEKYASELGLNLTKFKAALDSNKFDARVSADMAEAARSGVQGTPTFFINGRQLVGAQPIDQFKALIDEELKKSGKRPADEPKKTAKK